MLTGSIVALVTPMDEKGNICRSSLKKLVNYHINNGTSAIVSAGTTGESATLNYDELFDIVSMTLELSNGRIPIIAGISSNATSKTVKLIQSFNNSGIAAFLTVTPYYNCPTQEGLFQHFKTIAECNKLPHILYNVPYRTGCDMLPETIGRLSKVKNIIGVKEATGDLSRVHRIKELVSDDFILLTGDDITALDFLQLGGNGVISVTANVAARDMAKICALSASGHYRQARLLNQRLIPLHKKLFIEPNPTPVKWACKKLGLIETDTVRLPMIQITNHSRELIYLALKNADLI